MRGVQVSREGVTEGNIALDAAIICLCFAMKRSSSLEDTELLRRVKKYFEIMDLAGAPGSRVRELS